MRVTHTPRYIPALGVALRISGVNHRSPLKLLVKEKNLWHGVKDLSLLNGVTLWHRRVEIAQIETWMGVGVMRHLAESEVVSQEVRW